jgi:hypothetical protein
MSQRPQTCPTPTWDRFAKWKPFTRTRVTISSEELGFGLSESTKRVPHVPTAEEKGKLDKGERYGIPEFDEMPSGELSLWISVPERLGVRTHWNDAKHQRIEGCLNSFVSGLVAAAHSIKNGREDEERRRQAVRLARHILFLIQSTCRATLGFSLLGELERVWFSY